MVEKNTKIINIKVELELNELGSLEQILGNIDNGGVFRICGEDAELKILSADNTLSFNGGSVVEFMLTFSVNVAAGVLGNYIYNLCKGGRKLTLNNQRTRITEETIEKAINETIAAETIDKVVKKRDDFKG